MQNSFVQFYLSQVYDLNIKTFKRNPDKRDLPKMNKTYKEIINLKLYLLIVDVYE